MSLHPHPLPPIPEETARAARGAFRRGHPYLKLWEEFGTFFHDEAFASLFSLGGQPAVAPWRLALVTLLQFAEGLSDRQAADAVRGRIDWKYLLALPLEDAGFDASVLSEFRTRLVAGGAAELLFETLLTAFRERGLVKERGQQRTDATHVLAAIRTLNRLELVGETLRHALDALAVADPHWLLGHSGPGWIERYGRRFTEWRLPQQPAKREALALTIGADGYQLLGALYGATAPFALSQLPAVQVLRQVWLQQYYRAGERLRFRTEEELPPAPVRLLSPHDAEARAGKKGALGWAGYKVHFTESCDRGRPRLITDVQTTPAPVDDSQVLPTIHATLSARGLLPARHLVDAGYVEGAGLVASQQNYGIDLVGPMQGDTSWQAREAQGFAAADFRVDWERRTVTCPGGKESAGWRDRVEDGRPVVKAHFARRDCLACPLRERCTRSAGAGRQVTLPVEEVYRALQAAREWQQTEAFATVYAARAGIEGTHSQGVRRCDLRECRYEGRAKTHLQHLLTGAAISLVRVGEHLMGREPARTRRTRFAQLATVLS